MDDQYIYDINEFNTLTDDDIENLYKVVLMLGGIIPNPSYVITVLVSAAAPPTNIPSPQEHIYAVSGGLFKIGMYFVKH